MSDGDAIRTRLSRKPPPATGRVRPAEAWRGVRALIRDPEDTAQVFRVIRALAGGGQERLFQRFLRSEHGAAILARERELIDVLSDRGALSALPPGSLGRCYLAFTERESLTAEGLVDASARPDPEPAVPCPIRARFGARLRDSHDLWHVVTGYGRDLLGESALLAFTWRQTRNRGIGFIVAVAYLQADRSLPQERSMIRDGLRRAKSAAWLPGADWEALLPRSLDDVRGRLSLAA